MMQRRHLLKTLVASTITASAASTLPLRASASASPSSDKHAAMAWRNWSGNLSASPAQRFAPSSVAQLQEWLAQAQGPVRMVGAGHSFSPLVPTSGNMVSVRRLAGLASVDTDKQRASIYAGSTLGELGPLLNEHQQALVNMPDIDQQTLAGAIATATHGTGLTLGCLSAYVDELDIVTAQGDLLTCNKNQHQELFEASRVGLGATGIITRVGMQNRSAFRLERQAEWLSFEDCMDQAKSLAEGHRNFEFFYIPFTGMVLSDRLNITDQAPTAQQELDGNDGLMDLKLARDTLSWAPKLRELILGGYMKTLGSHSNVDHSYAIYANERNVRFNEMEYHLPLDNGLNALREVKQRIERDFSEVFFPIESRFIAADGCWLSPFYQRPSMSIAVHRYFEEDHRALFKAIEPILQKHGGRPHWGKVNSFTSQQIAEHYPRWADFKRVREHYDPTGRFLNDYLKQILLSA